MPRLALPHRRCPAQPRCHFHRLTDQGDPLMSQTLTRHGPALLRRAVVGVTAAAALAATALLPLAAFYPARAVDPADQAAPVFGVNMSLFDSGDHLATDSATQALFAGWKTPTVRVPLRATYPN